MNSIFEALKKLSKNQRKEPSYIYLDENTGQINEIPLSKDMAASVLMNYKNPAKLIHESIFHQK